MTVLIGSVQETSYSQGKNEPAYNAERNNAALNNYNPLNMQAPASKPISHGVIQNEAYIKSDYVDKAANIAKNIINKNLSGSAIRNQNIHKNKNVNWARTFLWDVKFYHINGKQLPDPFGDFFPAYEVEDNLLTSQSFQFDAGHSTIKLPQTTTNFDIRITFMDDEYGTLEKFMVDWVDSIYGDTVAYLDEAVKWLQVIKLNSFKEQIKTNTYLVYPEGGLYGKNDSADGVRTFDMTFIVAGMADNKKSGV